MLSPLPADYAAIFLLWCRHAEATPLYFSMMLDAAAPRLMLSLSPIRLQSPAHAVRAADAAAITPPLFYIILFSFAADTTPSLFHID